MFCPHPVRARVPLGFARGSWPIFLASASRSSPWRALFTNAIVLVRQDPVGSVVAKVTTFCNPSLRLKLSSRLTAMSVLGVRSGLDKIKCRGLALTWSGNRGDRDLEQQSRNS